MAAPAPSEESGPGSEHELANPEPRFANDRHVLLGVSHPSNDPARHRTFEVRASYDRVRGGWVARVGEQNLNEQRGDWSLLGAGVERGTVFRTAAACLGDAATRIVALVDQEAEREA